MVIEIILFIVGMILGIFITYIFLQRQTEVKFQSYKMEYEKQIRTDTQERMRAVLKGRIGEQFAPLLPMFEYEPSDARFIGSPVDYIVFDGYSSKNPQKIVFVEVKTGKTHRLTNIEKSIKQLVENKNVEWKTISIGDIGTEINEIIDESDE